MADDVPAFSMTVRLQYQQCTSCKAPVLIRSGEPVGAWEIRGRGFTPHAEDCTHWLEHLAKEHDG